jgi:hypothetical protein
MEFDAGGVLGGGRHRRRRAGGQSCDRHPDRLVDQAGPRRHRHRHRSAAAARAAGQSRAGKDRCDQHAATVHAPSRHTGGLPLSSPANREGRRGRRLTPGC